MPKTKRLFPGLYEVIDARHDPDAFGGEIFITKKEFGGWEASCSDSQFSTKLDAMYAVEAFLQETEQSQ
jgi:hypothetical protein